MSIEFTSEQLIWQQKSRSLLSQAIWPNKARRLAATVAEPLLGQPI